MAPYTSTSRPLEYDEALHNYRVAWVSDAFMRLFDMGGSEASFSTGDPTARGASTSAMRALVGALWRSLFVLKDYRRTVATAVVYRGAVPAHLVCIHTFPCVLEEPDGQRHWACLAQYDYRSPDFVERVRNGILLEHQALKYTPTLVTMTDIEGRVVYQNLASIRALGVHASHMHVETDVLTGQAEPSVSYLNELFCGNQELLEEMTRVTGAGNVFRSRLQICSEVILRWLHVSSDEIWHDVQIAKGRHRRYIVAQVDVTSAVMMERQVALLQEQQRNLLASILPQQVVDVLLRSGGDLMAVPRTDTSTSFVSKVLCRASLCSAPSGMPKLFPSGALPPSPEQQRPSPSKHHPFFDSANSNLPADPALMHQQLSDLSTYHDQVTVLFSDIEGFTSMSERCHPSVVLVFLNELYSAFDKIIDSQGRLGVYKVETIGDSYMVCGGLFHLDAEGNKKLGGNDLRHADKVLAFARAMIAVSARLRTPLGEPVNLRIGIHSGPCMSGVVGQKMPRFCLFGDTVNTASRMERTGVSGRIHVSQAARDLLAGEDWCPSGGVHAKGKGYMQTYLLQA